MKLIRPQSSHFVMIALAVVVMASSVAQPVAAVKLAQLSETGVAQLTLSKTVDQALTNPGKNLTYTVVVKNTGNADAINVLVTDTLPSGFTFTEGGRQTKMWTFKKLAAGVSETVTFTVQVSDQIAAGEYVNQVLASANGIQPISANVTTQVKIPQVLGLAETGIGVWDYFVFMAGLSLLSVGVTGALRYRKRD